MEFGLRSLAGAAELESVTNPVGAFADRPPASDLNRGRTYYATDAKKAFISTGSEWVQMLFDSSSVDGAVPPGVTEDNQYIDDNKVMFGNGWRDPNPQTVHVSPGTPGASNIGDVAAQGAGPTFAYSDHKHAREAISSVDNSPTVDQNIYTNSTALMVGDYTPAAGVNLFMQANSKLLVVPGANLTQPVTLTGTPYNELMNGGFDFCQRTNPSVNTNIAGVANTTDGYSADGWKVAWSTQPQYQRGGNDLSGGSYPGLTALNLGNWSVPGGGKLVIYQPLEEVPSVALAGQQMSFQFKWGAAMTIPSGTFKIKAAVLAFNGAADTLPATIVSAFGASAVDPTLVANLTLLNTPISSTVSLHAVPDQINQVIVNVTIPGQQSAIPYKNLIVVLWTDSAIGATQNLFVTEAGFYLGNTTTAVAWTPQDPQKELDRCKRWYQKSFPVDTAPVAGTSAGFHAMSANGGTVMTPEVRFNPEMRTTPGTITWLNPVTAASNQVRDVSTGTDCTATSTNSSSSTAALPQATLPGGSAVGNQLIVCWTADASL